MGRGLRARALALYYKRHPRKRRERLMLGVWSGEINVCTTGGVDGLGSHLQNVEATDKQLVRKIGRYQSKGGLQSHQELR